MAGENESFILSIGLLLAAVLFIARLMAIKLNCDPIMRRYKPGTPQYNAYRKLVRPRRFTISLGVSLLVVFILASYVISTGYTLVRANTPSSHYILIFGPIAAVVIFIVALSVGYYMLIKD